MRYLVILLLVAGTAFAAWAFLDDPGPPEESDSTPIDASRTEVPDVVPLRAEPSTSPATAPGGPAARIALLRPGEELPSPEALGEPQREIRFVPGARGLDGAAVLESVAKGLYIRATSAGALRLVRSTSVPEHWSEPDLVVPVEEILEVWRRAGIDVSDAGHVLVVAEIPGAGRR